MTLELAIRKSAKRIARMAPPLRRLFEQRDSAIAAARSTAAALAEYEARLGAASAGSDQASIERLLLGYRGEPSPVSHGIPAPRPVDLDDRYRQHMTQVLKETFFRNWSAEALASPVFAQALAEHLNTRFEVFARNVVPWIAGAAGDMSGMTAIEIGSGTGASTLAFAPHLREIVCYEIDAVAVEAARQRMAHFGLTNVEQRVELLGPDSELVRAGRSVDMVVLCAVLEHMSFDELTTALGTAWNVLKPGGLLVVSDTPNRLAGMDHHTSLLPFFSALPMDVMLAYAARSPREAFRDAIHETPSDRRAEVMTRWGRGISYHDFELAIAPDIHDRIVLDGYEPIITQCCPLRVEDALLRLAFDHFGVRANRAFTRTNLYFAARK